MNDDRDNSNIQSRPEGSSADVNVSPEEKDILVPEQSIEPDKEVNSSSEEKDTPSSKQSIESDKEDPTNKHSSVNGWLLLLVLLMTLGTGFYFYSYKEDSSFFTTLPDSLMKLFSTAPQLKNLPAIQSKEPLAIPPEKVIKKVEEATSPETQSKEIPAKFSGEIVDQTKRTTLFDKTINENEKTIDLLRNEIQSLKAELKQKSSLPQNFRIKRPHISGGFLEEKPEEIIQQERKKPTSTMITLPAIPSPAKGEPLNQQSHLKKKSPQKRSEEVQAYLDFVESTGGKLIEWTEKGWTRFQALVMEYRKNN